MSSSDSKTNWNRRTILKLAGAAAGAAVLPRSASANRKADLLQTRFSREFGLKVPLASAGMGFVGLTDLTTAVANAGALGVYGAAPEPPPVVAARLAEIKQRASGVFAVDFIVATAPIGVFTTQDHIDVAAAAHLPLVVFHFDLPERDWVSQLHAAGSKVFVQTGDVSVAQQAVLLGADGIIAQGKSAGGHNKNMRIPTLRLVHNLRRILPQRTFILASGGIANGHRLVQAIRAGADGGWAGTVFVAAEESFAHPGYKQRLIDAHRPQDTTFTTVFGPEWTAPQRVLRNNATDDPASTTPPTIGSTVLFPNSAFSMPYTMPKHSAIIPTRLTTGDLDEMDMPAGSRSVKAVRKVRPAAAIVKDFIVHGHEAAERDDNDLDLDDD